MGSAWRLKVLFGCARYLIVVDFHGLLDRPLLAGGGGGGDQVQYAAIG